MNTQDARLNTTLTPEQRERANAARITYGIMTSDRGIFVPQEITRAHEALLDTIAMHFGVAAPLESVMINVINNAATNAGGPVTPVAPTPTPAATETAQPQPQPQPSIVAALGIAQSSPAAPTASPTVSASPAPTADNRRAGRGPGR